MEIDRLFQFPLPPNVESPLQHLVQITKYQAWIGVQAYGVFATIAVLQQEWGYLMQFLVQVSFLSRHSLGEEDELLLLLLNGM